MQTNRSYEFYIGIDCGVATGFCIWNKVTRVIHFIDTRKIHQAMDEVRLWHSSYPGQVFVRVEDARLRKWIPRGKNEKAELGRREGAGSVKRDSIVWEDFLTDLQVPFEMVAPKANNTKITADYFKKLTKYSGSTSGHARDAAMLVYGY